MPLSFNEDFYHRYGRYPWQNPYEGAHTGRKTAGSLTIHCLACDDTYEEHQGVIVEVCPHCGNSDMMNTVYMQEENES